MGGWVVLVSVVWWCLGQGTGRGSGKRIETKRSKWPGVLTAFLCQCHLPVPRPGIITIVNRCAWCALLCLQHAARSKLRLWLWLWLDQTAGLASTSHQTATHTALTIYHITIPAIPYWLHGVRESLRVFLDLQAPIYQEARGPVPRGSWFVVDRILYGIGPAPVSTYIICICYVLLVPLQPYLYFRRKKYNHFKKV